MVAARLRHNERGEVRAGYKVLVLALLAVVLAAGDARFVWLYSTRFALVWYRVNCFPLMRPQTKLEDVLDFWRYSLLNHRQRRRARRILRRTYRAHPWAAGLMASIASPIGMGNDGKLAYDLSTRTFFGSFIGNLIAAGTWHDVTAPQFLGGAKHDGITEDSAAVQAAAPAGFSGAIFFPPSANAYMVRNVTVRSNQVWVGFPGTATLSWNTTGNNILQNVTGALDQVQVVGLNFDMQGAAWSALVFSGSDALGQVTNVTLRDLQLRRPSTTWAFQFNYTIVDPAVPASKNLKIRIEDLRDDALGQTFNLENAILVNCEDVGITGCRFLNATSTLGAHLGIYAYDRDIRVIANEFRDYLSIRAAYSIQSDTVKYAFNDCRTASALPQAAFWVFNCHDVTVQGGDVTHTANSAVVCTVFDFGTAFFDGHTDIYGPTIGVKMQGVGIHGGFGGLSMDLTNTQGQQDIVVQACVGTPFRNLFRIINVPAAPSATALRLSVLDNHIQGHSGFTGAGLIGIYGNAAAPNGGIQGVFIMGNVIPASGGAAGCDCEITGLIDFAEITRNNFGSPAATGFTVAAACTNVNAWSNTGPAGTPTSSNLGANVTSSTSTGNNHHGVEVIVMGGALAANTRICTKTFNNGPFGATAPRVRLINQTSGVGLAVVTFYILAQGTGQTFDLASDQALAAGTYTLAYDVIPAGVS